MLTERHDSKERESKAESSVPVEEVGHRTQRNEQEHDITAMTSPANSAPGRDRDKDTVGDAQPASEKESVH